MFYFVISEARQWSDFNQVLKSETLNADQYQFSPKQKMKEISSGLTGLESSSKSGSSSTSSPVHDQHVFCDINCNNEDKLDPKDSGSDLKNPKPEHNRLVQFFVDNSNCFVTLAFMLFLILSSYMLR